MSIDNLVNKINAAKGKFQPPSRFIDRLHISLPYIVQKRKDTYQFLENFLGTMFAARPDYSFHLNQSVLFEGVDPIPALRDIQLEDSAANIHDIHPFLALNIAIAFKRVMFVYFPEVYEKNRYASVSVTEIANKFFKNFPETLYMHTTNSTSHSFSVLAMFVENETIENRIFAAILINDILMNKRIMTMNRTFNTTCSVALNTILKVILENNFIFKPETAESLESLCGILFRDIDQSTGSSSYFKLIPKGGYGNKKESNAPLIKRRPTTGKKSTTTKKKSMVLRSDDFVPNHKIPLKSKIKIK